uniref:CD99 antigen-like protein 2 n=1 Tax=Esox lucius TaxID=8010 RepID=A0AAY5L6L9_ESOLU
MRNISAWSLFLVVSLLAVKVWSQGDFSLDDALDDVTKAPTVTPKPVPSGGGGQPASDELDLADALDPNNDIGGKDKNKGQGGSFSDDDLFGVSKDDTYKPDKGKGGRGGSQSADENNYDTDTMAETGTIAGIVSAVGVALVGAITSYISYQKKKFCFSIQQSLQGDLVKTENPDAVVATEPQVQQTLLEPPNAEPPSEENVV